jgi:hypothetical protein
MQARFKKVVGRFRADNINGVKMPDADSRVRPERA